MEAREEYSDLDIVERCPHDQDNPYTMINNDLFRNPKLSVGCMWLLGYLLTNTNSWRITVSQIINHMTGRLGRNKIYELIKEAIEAGYMRRQTVTRKNLRNQVKYFVSEVPRYNQTLLTRRLPGFRDTEPRDTEIRYSQEDHKKEEYKKEEENTSLKVSSNSENVSITRLTGEMFAKANDIECFKEKPSRKKAEFTTQVKDVTADMIATLIKHEPEYKPPSNLAAFMTEVDYMIRLDKRDPDKIVEVLNWALADHFWRDKMFKPNSAKYLREKYLQLKNQMEAPAPKKDRKFAASSNDKQAYETLKEMDRRAL